MNFEHGFHLWRALGMTGDGDVISQDALVAIHWTHRTFAIVVVLYLLWLAAMLRRFESLRTPATAVLVVILIQFLQVCPISCCSGRCLSQWRTMAGLPSCCYYSLC